jgi:acylphosphatase
MNTEPKFSADGRRQGYTLSILVSGKVQGVYYRHSTKEKAKELGVTGEVKNLPDNNVFIIATGTKEQLDELISWCKQGPARAVVKNIITETITLQYFEEFRIVR